MSSKREWLILFAFCTVTCTSSVSFNVSEVTNIGINFDWTGVAGLSLVDKKLLNDLSVFESLDQWISRLTKNLDQSLESIRELRHQVNELSTKAGKIDNIFQRFIELTEKSEDADWDVSTVEGFVNETLSNKPGLHFLLEEIHDIVVGSRNGVVNFLAEHIQVNFQIVMETLWIV